eukprot:TRINITY_DN3671_c0_g2_i1.p1 TRINITY_DN3671_c0_g2~~TRINITY_DN3671_c0_g2_i1.p1  ORF type:complete len:710 (+),score=270.31 TRINITY_DN3671_c0_g2_i1:146-2275(+)
MSVRERLEELAEQHRREEQNIVQAMRSLLQRSADEDRSRLQREGLLCSAVSEFENRLQQVTSEKQQALELYQQFKDQGGGIIQRLSQALTELQARYAEEGRRCTDLERQVVEQQQELRQRNARLAELGQQLAAAQLVNCPGGPSSPAAHAVSAGSVSSSPLGASAVRGAGEQVRRLEDLVREKDARIVQLEHQLTEQTAATAGEAAAAALQRAQREAEQLRQRQQQLEISYQGRIDEYRRLLDEENRLLQQAEEANERLRKEKAEIWELTRAAEGPEEEDQEARSVCRELLRTPQEQIEAAGRNSVPNGRAQNLLQHSVVRMLVQQLKAEKRHRLETEEQSSRILAETGRTVAGLEARLAQQQQGVLTPRLSRTAGPDSPDPRPHRPPAAPRTDAARRNSHADPAALAEGGIAEAEAILSASGSVARSSTASPPPPEPPPAERGEAASEAGGGRGGRSLGRGSTSARDAATAAAAAAAAAADEAAGVTLRVPPQPVRRGSGGSSERRQPAEAPPAVAQGGQRRASAPALPAEVPNGVGNAEAPPAAAAAAPLEQPAPEPSEAGGLLQRLRRHVQSPPRAAPPAATPAAAADLSGLQASAARLGVALPATPPGAQRQRRGSGTRSRGTRPIARAGSSLQPPTLSRAGSSLQPPPLSRSPSSALQPPPVPPPPQPVPPQERSPAARGGLESIRELERQLEEVLADFGDDAL